MTKTTIKIVQQIADILRGIVQAFFATIFFILLWGWLTEQVALLPFAVLAIFYIEFWILMGVIGFILAVARFIAIIVIPRPTGGD